MGDIAPDGTAADQGFEYVTGKTFKEKVGAYGDAVEAEMAANRPAPVDQKAQVKLGALGDSLQANRKRRASSTLFTGGQGALDTPTASSLLMGL